MGIFVLVISVINHIPVITTFLQPIPKNSLACVIATPPPESHVGNIPLGLDAQSTVSHHLLLIFCQII